MNAIGIALAWCVVQVTLVSLLASGLYLLVRWWRPAAASSVAIAGMMMVVVLSLLAMSPWPRWTFFHTPRSIAGEWSGMRGAGISFAPQGSDQDGNAFSLANGTTESSTSPVFWQTLAGELSGPQTTATANPRRWPTVAAVLLLAAMAGGLGWLVLGVVAVRWERFRSRPVDDSELLELVDVLCAELNCLRPIEVRECYDLVTAATIGWRRPVLLAPANWRTWTPDQLRAVLAHEIAHARSHDFLTLLLGQLGVALHFYHPLLHWLMNRLRLEQELAADAAAASISGGQRQYLTTIAELALCRQDRPMLWPARSFLPTQTTFLRRIAMLRDSKLCFDRISPVTHWTTVGVVLLCGALVAGLRGPAGQQQTLAEDFPSTGEASGTLAAQEEEKAPQQTSSAAKKVEFVIGPNKFAEGDKVTIQEVWSELGSLAKGDTVTVKGTYTLASRPNATLSLYITQDISDISKDPEVRQDLPSIQVQAGTAPFEMKRRITCDGHLHFGFYPRQSGNCFGTVYFGTDAQMKEISHWNVENWMNQGHRRLRNSPSGNPLSEFLQEKPATGQPETLAEDLPSTGEASGTLAKNILSNPGAEDGDKTPDHWEQGQAIPGVKYSWDKNVAFEGKASLCIEKTVKRYFPTAEWSQTVERKGNLPCLELSAQVKTKKMFKAVLDVVFLDEGGQPISHEWAAYIGSKKGGDPPANHDWKKYSGRVKIPAGTTEIGIVLQDYGPGTVWFDDIQASYTNNPADDPEKILGEKPKKNESSGDMIVEGVGWKDVLVGMSREDLLKAMGKPDGDPASNILKWQTKHMECTFHDGSTVVSEVRFNQGFQGALANGVKLGSSGSDVLKLYGEPSHVIDRNNGAKEYEYSDKGILFWSARGKISQIVVFKPYKLQQGQATGDANQPSNE